MPASSKGAEEAAEDGWMCICKGQEVGKYEIHRLRQSSLTTPERPRKRLAGNRVRIVDFKRIARDLHAAECIYCKRTSFKSSDRRRVTSSNTILQDERIVKAINTKQKPQVGRFFHHQETSNDAI